MAIAGVYKLVDPETGAFYIGSTGNIEKRFARHMNDLKCNRHSSFRMQLHHDGSDGVNWKLDMSWLTDDREDAYRVEDELIKMYSDDPLMLNSSISAKGMALRKGSKEHDRWSETMSKSLLDKYETMSKEERKVLFGKPGELNGMFGRKHTDEVKQFNSQLNKGNSYAKGSKRTPAQCAFLSELAMSKTGCKNPFFGKKHSDETKQHLSRVKKANPKLPGNARTISIDGKVYESLMAAKRTTGVSQALLIYRIKSNKQKYSGYCYV
jgi:group I intron endonuclease